MQLQQNRFLWYHLPAIGWAVLIFVASSIPNASLPPIGIEYEDKWIHLLIYGVFGFLVARSFFIQAKSRWMWQYFWLFSIAIGVVYGITDEFHQRFVPGRYPEILDAVADAVGSILGVMIFLLISKKRWRGKKKN